MERPPIAVVTGASSGIGRATARALAGAGVPVLATGRREGALAELVSEAAGGSCAKIETVAADVAHPDGRAILVETVAGRTVAALVHGAGVFPRGRLDALAPADWSAALATNFEARLWLTLALRAPLRGGRVLFVGSDAATRARAGGAAYSVSKAASAMLRDCLAAELGDEIAFGIAKPGLVETPMMDASLAAPADLFPARDVYASMRERGETITPATIAAFFRWLLLDVPREAFAERAWDVRDEEHHRHWLEGRLYRGERSN